MFVRNLNEPISIEGIRFLREIDPSARPREIIEAFNEELSARLGVVCVEAAFRQSHLSRLLDCRSLEPFEKDKLLSSDAEVHVIGESRMLPIRLSNRVIGALFVQPDSGVFTQSGMEAAQFLAAEIAAIAENARLRELLRRTKNHLDLLTTQDDLSDRLDESLGGLALIWQSISDEARRRPDSETLPNDLLALRGVIREGLMTLEAAAGSLASRRVEELGLVEALRDLLASFERVAGVSTSLRVQGPVSRMDRGVEENLYGIAFTALATSEVRSRATAVVISLSYIDPVEMTIRDDGVGLINRSRRGPWPGIHHSMKLIQEKARSIGATVELDGVRPRGIRLVIRIAKAGSALQRPFSA